MREGALAFVYSNNLALVFSFFIILLVKSLPTFLFYYFRVGVLFLLVSCCFSKLNTSYLTRGLLGSFFSISFTLYFYTIVELSFSLVLGLDRVDLDLRVLDRIGIKLLSRLQFSLLT